MQWLRDGLGLIKAASETEALAATVPDSGGVFLVPAFAGLGAPHWDPYARGALVGITRGTTAGHLARAALEAIAFQVADLLDAMQADSGVPLPELRVDGGASHNELLLQIQADLLGRPVVRAARSRRRPPSAPPIWPGWPRASGRTTQPWPPTARPGTASSRRWMRRTLASLRERWSAAVERAKGWETALAMNRDEMLSQVRDSRPALGRDRRGRRRHRAWEWRSTPPRAATRCCFSSRATSARAPRAAAPSSSTAAFATSSRATWPWSWRRSASAGSCARTRRTS